MDRGRSAEAPLCAARSVYTLTRGGGTADERRLSLDVSSLIRDGNVRLLGARPTNGGPRALEETNGSGDGAPVPSTGLLLRSTRSGGSAELRHRVGWSGNQRPARIVATEAGVMMSLKNGYDG